jgi:hypothetical protein
MIDRRHAPKTLQARYATAEPFPHIVIDGFFIPRFAEEIATELEQCDIGHWSRDDHARQVPKRWMDDPERLPRMARIGLRHMNSPAATSFMSELTGIDDLQPDPAYLGGGAHVTLRGGSLGVHSDFDLHPGPGLHRRVNALLFFNRSWDPSWHGQLELWSKEAERPAVSVDPSLNRLVVFTITEDALHGVPTPLECPPNRRRFSLALYYYTANRPEPEQAPWHRAARQQVHAG